MQFLRGYMLNILWRPSPTWLVKQEAQLSLRDRATRACQLKSG